MSMPITYSFKKVLSLRIPRTRWWAVAVALVIAFFLFTPKSPENICIHNITFFGVAEIPHNCDSVSMVNALGDVPDYITGVNYWKGRPVYMLTGYVFGQMLLPITKPVWQLFLNKNSAAQSYKKNFAKNFHYHVAFILINFAIVFFAARYAIFVSGLNPTHFIAIALAVAVSSIDLVEGFVFVLHTSLFNLLSAFGAVAYVGFGISAYFRSHKQTVLLGVIVGMGVLSYPVIAILAPAYLVGLAYGMWRWPDLFPNKGRCFVGAGLFVATCAAFPLAWMALNSFVFETYTYATATVYKQFTWPLEAYRNGELIARSYVHFKGFLASLLHYMWVEFIFIGVILTALAVKGRLYLQHFVRDPALFSLLIGILGVLSFNYLQDFNQARMQMPILILLYTVIARVAVLSEQTKLGNGALICIGAYQLVNAALYTSLQYE